MSLRSRCTDQNLNCDCSLRKSKGHQTFHVGYSKRIKKTCLKKHIQPFSFIHPKHMNLK